MKKIVLIIVTIVMIAALGVSFAACDNATPTQKLLSNSRPWTSRDTDEVFVYNVVYKKGTEDELNGTMTVTVKSFNGAEGDTVTIGEWTKEKAIGYLTTTTLEMDNGDVKNTQAFFTTNVEVKYASETKTYGGVTSGYTAEYKNEKCYYTVFEGDDKSSGEIKTGDFSESPFIDNAILYQVARCIPSSVSSFTFDVPDVTLGDTQSVTMSAATGTTTTIKAADEAETEFKCYFVQIALNRTFPGSGESLTCMIASDPYETENGEIKKLVVSITEGDTTYTLVSAKD